jgi:hypothetical protein
MQRVVMLRVIVLNVFMLSVVMDIFKSKLAYTLK